MSTRRDILAVLGLSTTLALSTEETTDKAHAEELAKDGPLWIPALSKKGPGYQDTIAHALESLANAIRNRDAIACDLETASRASGEEWLSHEIKVVVELPVARSEVRAVRELALAEEKFFEAQRKLDEARETAKKIVAEAREQAAKIAAG